MVYDFSISILQIKVWNYNILNILSCKYGSYHSGMPFFIFLLNSYLRTQHSTEPTFQTSEITIYWKKNLSIIYIFLKWFYS